MIIYCNLTELNCCANLGTGQVCNNGHGVSSCDHATSFRPEETVVSNDTSLDLDRFKVAIINCDDWIVPSPIEKALKEICRKHNDLVDFLSVDT